MNNYTDNSHAATEPLVGSQKFALGSVFATPNASLQVTHDEMLVAIQRHSKGDWGDVCPEDRLVNDQAASDGASVLSSYRAASGASFWVITEGDRSVTTVLLPEEY